MNNNAGLAIRHKLYDFIRIADDKNLYAIYHLPENEIEQTQEWWKDKVIVDEIDHRCKALEDGSDKGCTVGIKGGTLLPPYFLAARCTAIFAKSSSALKGLATAPFMPMRNAFSSTSASRLAVSAKMGIFRK
jgi:hypothetical protein